MHSPLQINDFRWKETGLWLLKVAVMVGCVFYILEALGNRAFETLSWKELVSGRLWMVSVVVLILVPINWYLEVVKWKLCVKPLIRISSKQALWSVLRGLSLNWVVPFTLGDFIGRSLDLPNTKGAIRANLVNRFASLWVTMLMFGIGAVFFCPAHQLLSFSGLVLIILILVGAMTWDDHYPVSVKLKILLISVTRYLVFGLQFGLLLFHFCPEIPMTVLLSGMPVVFLIRTLAPSLLGALGVREAAVLWTFSAFTDFPANLLMASLILWMFNLVLPSLVGLLPVLSFRFKLSA